MAKDMAVYTIEELESILNVTRRTLYTYIKEGKLKAVKMGKYWRVRGDQLEEFLSSDTGKRYMTAENPDTWTDQERELIDKARKLKPEDVAFLIKIITMTGSKKELSAFIEQEAPNYRLSTPEGKSALLDAIRAAGLA